VVVRQPGDRHDDLAAKIVAALDRLARGLRRDRQAFATRHGLTPLQLGLLRTIAEGPPPQPLVGLLATELGVAQPTITDSLAALDRKGLLRRGPDAADRRRTAVALSAEGEDLVGRAGDHALFEGVAALDPKAQEALLPALLAVIAHLVDAGVITVARTCLTCRFHRSDTPGGHHCTLLKLDLPPSGLRVNCPDHQARDEPVGAR
jgi:DNA-binding MarR family transcriptional regulator